eukprot:gene21817-28840_t
MAATMRLAERTTPRPSVTPSARTSLRIPMRIARPPLRPITQSHAVLGRRGAYNHHSHFSTASFTSTTSKPAVKPLTPIEIVSGVVHVADKAALVSAAIAHHVLGNISDSIPHFAKILYAFVFKATEAAFTKQEHLPLPPRRLPDLSHYLQPSDLAEVEHARKMSAMCAIVYEKHKLTEADIRKRFDMKLVSSSYAIKDKEECLKAAALAALKSPIDKAANWMGTTFSSLGSSWMDEEGYLGFQFLEWFTAQEESTNTRYFVIMGSDTMEHWRLNLTVDPVVFEDPALGVKIHRGVYEAADALYERFLPSVKQYLAANPSGKVCFTGHSIGGSLALALMLLFKIRGVIKAENISDVYTFGLPSIFLEGKSCFDHITSSSELCGCGPGGLLEAVGLPETIVRNVLMACDLVPRAFTCDYGCLAKLICCMGPGLKEHSLLANADHKGRRHLFFYVGKVVIMQPDNELAFTADDAPHPMLPPEPAMYTIKAPHQDRQYRFPHTPISADASISGSFAPLTTSEAVSELMDNPHPMEMFNNPFKTYGGNGGISRYHNPVHYTQAFGRITHRLKQQQQEQHSVEQQ